MTVFTVFNYPKHADCSGPPDSLVEPLAIYSAERRAWDRCKTDGRHSVGYYIVEADNDYANNATAPSVFPNCPKNKHPEPKDIEHEPSV